MKQDTFINLVKMFNLLLDKANQLLELQEKLILAKDYKEVEEYDRLWEDGYHQRFIESRLMILFYLEDNFGRDSTYYNTFEIYSKLSSFSRGVKGDKEAIKGAISALNAMEPFIVEF